MSPKRISSESEPPPFSCPDPIVGKGIARIEATTSSMAGVLTKLEKHVDTQNHRIEKLEHAHIKEQGVHEERQRWLEKVDIENNRRFDRVYRIMGIALTIGGLLMGATFSALNQILK